MAHFMPIHIVIIALYPKPINFGEERTQFMSVTYTTRVFTYYMLCLVLQCYEAFNQDIFSSKGSFLSNTFERSRLIT